MTPASHIILVGLLLAMPHVLHAEDLRVANGDFSDVSGLVPHGGHGWLQGVPTGWRATAPFPVYAVHTGPDGRHPVCNVSQLGGLEQQVGRLAAEADVVLTFDVSNEWHKGALMAAEMLDADGGLLGCLEVDAGRRQRLVVSRVAAGTAVVIRFHALHGTTPALDDVAVTTHSPGTQTATPQLRVRSFQPDQPLARARRPASVSVVLDHLGAQDIDVAVRLTLPPGVRPVEPPPDGLRRLRAADSRSRFTWSLEAADAMSADLRLEVRGPDGSTLVDRPLRMLFLPAVERALAAEPISAPVPVQTDRLIGAHHCPLWEPDQPNMWLNLLRHPERTPALGMYAQNDPEVADWETKWAVEHGISFFVYCWYRDGQGGAVRTRFGSGIHDGLFKSRFADRMKFALMWENQNRGTGGVADEADLFTNLLPYWMDNYFRHGSYLRVDNKPVLFIYRPELLIDDLGGAANVARAFARMRQVCRDAGFDGLYLLGEYRSTDPQHLQLMKEIGLDYTFAYCWPVPGNPTPEQASRTQMDLIRRTQELGVLPQVVTVSQGWSGWQDEGSIWKIPPTQFEDLLRQAKEFTARLPPDQLGSRMLLLDNWNEWGEGHAIAPHREHGFGYLDAVRRVFCPGPEDHVDLLPEDIGRGPYDTKARAHFAALEEKSRLASVFVADPSVPPGLVAWWTFDEAAANPVAADHSGNRNGGYLEGAARVPGFGGHALRCDGGSACIPRGQALGELQRFTVSCRVMTDSPDQDNRWIVNGVFGNNVCGGFRLGLLGGKPCFQVPQTEWSHHLVGEEPLPCGRWVHLAATFDGSTMRLFADGEPCGVMARPGNLVRTDGRLVLGSYDVAHPAFFTGTLDDVRVYRRVVRPEEIRAEATMLPR